MSPRKIEERKQKIALSKLGGENLIVEENSPATSGMNDWGINHRQFGMKIVDEREKVFSVT